MAESTKAEKAKTNEKVVASRSAFDRFEDLPIQAAVHLGRRRIQIRELLNLERESVIRLERAAGENVDLLLNGTIVGNGEIVVIEEMVGLRITDIREKKT